MNPKKSPKPQRAIRLFGAPEPEKFTSTSGGKLLSETAAIHFRSKTDKNIGRLLAIEKLVLDIFHDSQAARAFAVNPDEYLLRYGFTDVKLDLNSQEVRMAMAVGDPVAREAAARGDVDGFIDAILAQGIKPSAGLAKFVHVEALVHSSVVVYFIAVVVTYQKVVTAVPVPILIAVQVSGQIFEKAHHMRVLNQVAKHIADEEFSKQVALKSVETTVEKYTELLQEKLKSRTP